MKGIVGIQNSLAEIITALDESGFKEISSDLKSKQTDLEVESKRLDALKEIMGMCHIKSMGDLNVSGFDGWSWPNKISKVGTKCQRVINQIEKNT